MLFVLGPPGFGRPAAQLECAGTTTTYAACPGREVP